MCGLYLDWPVIAALQGFATDFLLCVFFYRFWVSSSECVNSQKGFWCLCCRNVFLCRKLEQEVEQLDLLAHVLFLITQNRQRFVKAKRWPNFTSYPPPSALSYPPDVPRCVIPPPTRTLTHPSPLLSCIPPILLAPPTSYCALAKDHLDEEQNDHRWRPQVSDAKQPGSVDSEYPQAKPVWWGQILLQGHQWPRGRRGGVHSGGSRYVDVVFTSHNNVVSKLKHDLKSGQVSPWQASIKLTMTNLHPLNPFCLSCCSGESRIPFPVLNINHLIVFVRESFRATDDFKQDDLLAPRADLNFSFSPQFYKRKGRRRRNERHCETAEDTVEQE